MKALIITESYLPNLGGVEKHIAGIKPYLEKEGFKLTIFSKKEIFKNRPLKKFIGLLQIWLELAKRIQLIKQADIIFIHDVFIYYLPFRIIFPRKKIITTFHGWEKIYPIPLKNILYKQLAQKLSNKTVSIGTYINKYYHLHNKNNYLSYGAVKIPATQVDLAKKEKNSFLFVGRLEKDTGLPIFLDFLNILLKKKIIFSVQFCGDGPMKKDCLQYGSVLGFVNVEKYLIKSEFCFAGGYLSILEAMINKNIVLSAFNNELKKDYLLDSPFRQSIIYADQAQILFDKYNGIQNKRELLDLNYHLAKKYSFEQLANLYIQLSQSR